MTPPTESRPPRRRKALDAQMHASLAAVGVTGAALALAALALFGVYAAFSVAVVMLRSVLP